MKNTILLIDGDIIAYRIAAASEKRSVKVIHKSGQSKEFSNRTEFRDLLKSKGTPGREIEYQFEDIQTVQPIEYCYHSINVTMRKLENATFADKIELYISGKDDNFRLNLPLPTRYKSNRDGMLRPVHLVSAKNYLLNNYEGIRAKKIEADDILNIRAYEELAKGNIPIIATNDKDTFQSEGVFMFDWTVENPLWIEIPVIGDLQKIGPTIKGAGLKFFAFQLLAGDKSDGYKPCELAGVRYGDTSAYKDLKDLNFQDEILNKVIEKYKEWYPEPFTYKDWSGKTHENVTWQDMLSLYFKCAYMKRTWTDPSDWKQFFAERGVYEV